MIKFISLYILLIYHKIIFRKNNYSRGNEISIIFALQNTKHHAEFYLSQ